MSKQCFFLTIASKEIYSYLWIIHPCTDNVIHPAPHVVRNKFMPVNFKENIRLQFGKPRFWLVNPLSPSSDKHLISPYIVITRSNMQVTRIKEMIRSPKIECLCFKQILLTYSIRNVWKTVTRTFMLILRLKVLL